MGELGNSQKMMIAVLCVFGVGFFMVGSNKDQSDEQKRNSAMVRDVANMQRMAQKKCPALIKKHTGSQVDGLLSTMETDKGTHFTLNWVADDERNFKNVSCTLGLTTNGMTITKFVVDGKKIIDK